MKPKSESERHNRQDWGIVLLILLIGFCCVAGAGQWALRLSPSWNLNSDMGSGLDPNTDFLTKPVGYFEPLDAGILTQPAWVKVFLTPGAIFATGTPPPAGAAHTSVPTQGQGITAVPLTVTLAAPTNTAVPTNTFVWLPPPPTVTPKHGNPPPPTSPVPGPVNADLQITQADGVNFYVIGTPLVYTVTVSNIGPDAITGATVTANLPPQIASWDWACTPAVASCNPMNGATPFSDTVDLPSGGSIVYTVTATISPAAIGDLTNTVNVTAPLGVTDPGGNNVALDTNNFTADLQIVKTNTSATYAPGGTLTYTVTVSNAGPNAVTGAVVTDNMPGQITSWDWACTAVSPGASGCDPMSGATPFSDTVNLASGASIQYTVTAQISGGASGDLTNQATVSVPVSAPAGYTDASGNNLASHMDPQAVGVANPFPDGGIGESQDGVVTPGYPASGSSVTLQFSTPLEVGAGHYLVYYEMAAGSGILMDQVIIQISSDGSTWRTIFNWGGGGPDTNSNLNTNVIGGLEDDNRDIPAALLGGGTGVSIQVDGVVPNGFYPYSRITAPGGDSGNDGVDIDGIVIMP